MEGIFKRDLLWNTVYLYWDLKDQWRFFTKDEVKLTTMLEF